MSDEVEFLASAISSLVAVGILSLGVYRSLQFSRSFIDPVYKSHARWIGFLLAVILVSNLNNFVPYDTSTPLGSFLSFVPFLAIVATVFAYVDRTILVAGRTDFFHRDTLRWGRLRLPAAVVLGFTILVLLVISALFPNTAPAWAQVGIYGFFLSAVVILGYGAVALVVSARRTSDRTFRRHVLLLGLALGAFVLLIGSFFLPTNDGTTILSDVISTGSLYILYRAVMSLSPLGKVEKDAVTTSKPNDDGIIQPSHPRKRFARTQARTDMEMGARLGVRIGVSRFRYRQKSERG